MVARYSSSEEPNFNVQGCQDVREGFRSGFSGFASTAVRPLVPAEQQFQNPDMATNREKRVAEEVLIIILFHLPAFIWKA
jgi:hypothetical protein